MGQKDLSFNVNVQNIRRKYMADAIFNMTKKEKKDETYTKRCVEILKNVGV